MRARASVRVGASVRIRARASVRIRARASVRVQFDKAETVFGNSNLVCQNICNDSCVEVLPF